MLGQLEIGQELDQLGNSKKMQQNDVANHRSHLKYVANSPNLFSSSRRCDIHRDYHLST